MSFSEAVTGFDLSDITAGNVVTVANGSVLDLAGNAGGLSAVSNPYAVNTPGIGATVTVTDRIGRRHHITGNPNNPVGLVIDTSHLPSNSTLQLDNVDVAGRRRPQYRDWRRRHANIFLGADDDVLGSGRAGRAGVLQFVALSDEHRQAQSGAAGYTIAEDRSSREMGWLSGSGDDVLNGCAGSDVLVGGDGTDTVVYGGKLAGYRFVLGKDGTLDLRFLQSKPSELATLGLLYQTVLDRAGDVGGFTWWLGQHRDTASLVQALYANTGLAQTAAGGMPSWVSYAATHTRAELVGAWIANGDVQAAQFGSQGLWIV